MGRQPQRIDAQPPGRNVRLTSRLGAAPQLSANSLLITVCPVAFPSRRDCVQIALRLDAGAEVSHQQSKLNFAKENSCTRLKKVLQSLPFTVPVPTWAWTSSFTAGFILSVSLPNRTQSS